MMIHTVCLMHCLWVQHRCASDVATAPEHSVVFDPKSGSAVGFGDGQPSTDDDFGLDLYGVADAATSGAGVFGGQLARMAGGEEEANFYAFSLPSSADRQAWMNILKDAGCSIDLDGTRAVDMEEKEKAALMAGAAGGGAAAGGGIGGIAAALGDAKSALTENLTKLSDMADQTAEMEDNAADFADMAKIMRERNEKKSKGFGL